MDRTLIENLIGKHEGRRAAVYQDSRGVLTIGCGWNLEDGDSQDICDHFGLDLNALKNGTETLTEPQIDQVFSYQLSRTISEAMQLFPNFSTMPDTVQAVVCDMIFNLGIGGFSKFHRTVAALTAGNWKQAAIDAGESLWAQQVPNRAKDDISLLNAA